MTKYVFLINHNIVITHHPVSTMINILLFLFHLSHSHFFFPLEYFKVYLRHHIILPIKTFVFVIFKNT